MKRFKFYDLTNRRSTINIEHRHIHLMRIAFENIIKNVSREPEKRTVNCGLCLNAENQNR